MRDLLVQIQRAVQADLYYCALISALAVPDICGAMEAPDGIAKKKRYADWFDRYVAGAYAAGPSATPSLTGEQCYAFRCSLLHQGRLQSDRTLTCRRMLFLEPSPTGGLIMHNNVMDEALNIDVRIPVLT